MPNLSLKEIYLTQVIPAMQAEFKYKSISAVPKIQKAIVNVGIGRFKEDPKIIEEIEASLAMIAGQKPVKTLAKKAISAFKLREGMKVGLKVTLRGEKMYSFLDRLINLALPRTRDFHGLNPKSVDQSGNLTTGIKEHIIFPEISHENIRHIFGFEVTVVTTAKNREESLTLLKLMGFPIKK